MKIVIQNGSMIFKACQAEVTKLLNVIYNSSSLFGPCREDGTRSGSGAYCSYIVDLSGLYAEGYRKVKFYAQQIGNANAKYYAGLICSGTMPETKSQADSGIENYVKLTSTNDLTPKLYELPLTANSSYLRVNICYKADNAADGMEVMNPKLTAYKPKASSYTDITLNEVTQA